MHDSTSRRPSIGALLRIAGVAAIAIAACTSLSAVPGSAAAAQPYPTKAVRWIVPFAPGGGADNLARMLVPGLTESLGHNVVIDNRGGGGGTIGTELVARAAPDGHTIAFVATGHTVNPSLMGKVPYDPVRDFEPVSLVASQPNLLVVHSSVAVKSVKELVELARAKPRTLNFASGGNGSSPHLSGELLKLIAGVEISHIPYKGSGPAIADLVGGHVQMMFVGPMSVDSHTKSGRLRALAVAEKKRLPILPDIPTMAEAGLPGIETGTWYAVLAPARTPKHVVERLNETFVKVTRSPEVSRRLTQQGVDIITSTPAELGAFLRSELAKWSKVVKAAKLTVD